MKGRRPTLYIERQRIEIIGQALDVAADTERAALRSDQDRYAEESQQRATRAIASGAFKDEIVPVPVSVKGKEVLISADEGPRSETTLDALARLNPAFQADGTVTAALNDTGGPVELRAEIHLSPGTRTGMLSGTLKEGPDATADLRNQLSSLAQMHARDASGRFPVDLEFTF